MKISWDVLDPSDLRLYLKTWREVIHPYFTAAKDYQCVQALIKQAVEKWADDINFTIS